MLKNKSFLVLMFLFAVQVMTSQSVEISGKVKSNTGSIENIHVINKTAQVFTITDKNGAFKITASLNDSLVFSSIQHKLKEVVVSKGDVVSKYILVSLDEQINELDVIRIGKVLTGDLAQDINSVEGKAPINFYNLGIPGYTGRIKTQSERRLSEAHGGGIKWYQPLTGSIPINPILNAISGRTKKLKNRVEIETKETFIHTIKVRLAEDFFASNPLDVDLRMDFFYFCSDDENFITYCKNKTDFEILVFLKQKYKQYVENLNTNKD
ncbi:peptidase associated/transthyretin-like domain-containing protein [Flavivirga eckloniae]|uniref:TonB-dependent receptor n=1 Tax=Flavivirga eckloniae TaxID=1803846 RepID=A0A2K9PPA3_9FLAO|nr:hypothetical protein [Flavivirga eckloniae]AUP78407.1 hypothetical protein C1H87_06660 [Flavivirga eckloniae]